MKINAQPQRGGWWFGGCAVVLCFLAAEAAAQRPFSLSGNGGGYRPAHVSHRQETTIVAKTPAKIDADEIVDGGEYYENDDGELILEHETVGHEQRVAGHGKHGSCCADGSCGSCMMPCCGIPIGSLEIFSGTQAFTGPINRGSNGSFGFHEGVNWGFPLSTVNDCLSAQIGFRATQSNLSGNEFTNDGRNQTFVTAGLFRRVDCGLQGGLAVDWLKDNWYLDADLTQARGELSWAYHDVHSLGFWFTKSTKTATVTAQLSPTVTATETWESTDLFAFFYRHQFGPCNLGEGRFFAGVSGESDGLIGSDCILPLLDSCSLETSFTYLIPQQSTGTSFDSGNVQESWNLSIALVWYPGKHWGGYDQYARPLFRVGDNGNFLVDRVP